ncbi:MAG: hypothetical protein IT427_01505 [Pirellulales bacterium]|nr:hypothetical protein [Pirellulales bacterium]
MNYKSWQKLTLEERLPWMRLAVEQLDGENAEGDHAILADLTRRAAVGVCDIDSDEAMSWSPRLLGKLVASGVLRPTDNAASVACNACGNDHVEKVEYVTADTGIQLRAYISCPDNGRVYVPLERLRRWIVDKKKLPAPVLDAPMQEEARNRDGKQHKAAGAAKRSWTQQDLDAAIQEYKAKRASTYHDLVDGVKRGKSGAQKNARDLFGRNAIVRALGVKSAAMVSGSSVWQTIADELRLRGRSRSTSINKSQRVGLDIALEDQAEASCAPILDQAIQQETTRLIEKSMPAKEAEATIEKLRRGEITDDKARELVEVFAQQQNDQRTRKVRQMP